MREIAVALWLILTFCGLCLAIDNYNEELIISRLPSGNLLSQFRFLIRSDLSEGRHYKFFPRIIGELIEKYEPAELGLSLAQGRWLSMEWGLPPQPSAPSGGQLHALLKGNSSSVDSKWFFLINSLNGVFCTSLSGITNTKTSSPVIPFLSSNSNLNGEYQRRFGSLGAEPVCTENLTPWKKLLPCKNNGLVSLLNPTKLYSSLFHSMGFEFVRDCSGSTCNYELLFFLDMVADRDHKTGTSDYALHTLFGRDVAGACNVADSSRILVMQDEEQFQKLDPPTSSSNGYAIYDLKSNSLPNPFTFSAFYEGREVLALEKTPISIYSRLGGTDQFEGKMITNIQNFGEKRRVIYTQIVDWFVVIHYSSLLLKCSAGPNKVEQSLTIYNKSYIPALSRERPAVIQYDFDLPKESNCDVFFKFKRSFLRMREYPPDANHGILLPASMLTLYDTVGLEDDVDVIIPVDSRTKMKGSNGRLVLHSNVVLIQLPVPDFSMPFNVICIVLIVFSIYFSVLHTTSTKIAIPVTETNEEVVKKLGSTSRTMLKIARVLFAPLLIGAIYMQYYDISPNVVRRHVEQMFEHVKQYVEKLNNM